MIGTNFKNGDLVKLKSGGPVMTISDLADKITCCWFVDGTLHNAGFTLESLKLFERKTLADKI